MTGRDLIIYILSNGLENEEIFKEGKFLGYMTLEEAALKYHVGIETTKLWYEMGFIPGIQIGKEIYIQVDFELKKG